MGELKSRMTEISDVSNWGYLRYAVETKAETEELGMLFSPNAYGSWFPHDYNVLGSVTLEDGIRFTIIELETEPVGGDLIMQLDIANGSVDDECSSDKEALRQFLPKTGSRWIWNPGFANDATVEVTGHEWNWTSNRWEIMVKDEKTGEEALQDFGWFLNMTVPVDGNATV